ncbi:hypothetical protein GR702_16515 [Novosphingobium sp. FGD1]|uniref:Uncharacterized protein n=1 Tax=Novosphingobium silvae TaxID=2692619 RepID=A0A7X4GIP5_9SPHN|nr:hypothetical protein [Novosphingobium silvae]
MLAIAGAAFAAVQAPGAIAAQEPATKLVFCGKNDCLLVSGFRADPASQVQLNGHPVKVEGGRAWKVRVPIATVRAWSRPRARTLDVMVLNADSRLNRADQAALPIGLLGQTTQLASLVIRSR